MREVIELYYKLSRSKSQDYRVMPSEIHRESAILTPDSDLDNNPQPRLNMNLVQWIQLGVGLISVPGGLVYASRFEYHLHKNHMHKKWNVPKWLGSRIERIVNYPYVKHHETHHAKVGADASFNQEHLQHGDETTMAWWNWILLVPLASSPFWLIWFVLTFITTLSFIILPTVATLMILIYYVIYESNHYLMHHPAQSRLGKWYMQTKYFQSLCARHLIHHKWPMTNYNVVWPLFDKWYNTLLRRSRTRFAQAGAPAPDVQPRQSAARPCIFVE
jgi:hypothetical protein